MAEDDLRRRLADLEERVGDLEDLAHRIADLEKVVDKFARTERLVDQMEPLLRGIQLLIEAAKRIDVEE